MMDSGLITDFFLKLKGKDNKETMLNQLKLILCGKLTLQVYLLFLDRGCLTALQIADHFKVASQNIYAILYKLQSAGIIEEHRRLPASRGGGRRTVLWRLVYDI